MPTATIDFAPATTALGTGWTDAMTFAIALIVGVVGSVMVAGGVLRGLRAIARHFGLGRAKV